MLLLGSENVIQVILHGEKFLISNVPCSQDICMINMVFTTAEDCYPLISMSVLPMRHQTAQQLLTEGSWSPVDHFDSGSDVIKRNFCATEEIDQVSRKPSLKGRIIGHNDSDGSG